MANNQQALTPMELGIINRFHEYYAKLGFPSSDRFVVASRVCDSSGRYTYFKTGLLVNVPDGELGLGEYGQLNVYSLPSGASFWVVVGGGEVKYLEIVVNGEYKWDNVEDGWVISDPDSGEFPPD